MKISWAIVLLLCAFICTSMTQCPRCVKGHFAVDKDAKKWLPYAGKDSITFITSSGSIKKFRGFYGDTTLMRQNFDCDDVYISDSVGFSLEISPADSLILSYHLSSTQWLCARVQNRDSSFLGICDIINGPMSDSRKNYPNLSINNFVYNDVRQVNSYPGRNSRFDSLFMAKNYGVVSFKYDNLWYYLKH